MKNIEYVANFIYDKDTDMAAKLKFLELAELCYLLFAFNG